MRISEVALAAGIALGAAPHARADDAQQELIWLRERVVLLEQRLEEVEARELRTAASAGQQGERAVQFGGSLNTNWLNGEENSSFDEGSFNIWDARFFLDAELSRDARVGERSLFSDATLTFEWDLVRLGDLMNDVGELYVDLRGLGGNRFLNAQVGRFQLPVGENYKRFGRGYSSNPLISGTVGGPWWWDEGVKLFGESEDASYGYVASLTDGEGFFNEDGSSALQTSLKLFVRPTEFLELSVSGLRSGELGSASQDGYSSLWLGEMWPQSFGHDTDVVNFQNGIAVPDGPEQLGGITLLGGDAIVQLGPWGRLWLGGGGVAIDTEKSSAYDRNLRYWIAELVLEGAPIARVLQPFYLALRANGLGTYERDEGYVLDFRTIGSLGFNARSLEAYSFGAGWRLSDAVTLRAEYTRADWDLVRGVTPEIRAAADQTDFFGAELGVEF